MPAPCYYHPDTPSTAQCVQCGMPICPLDTEMVAGKAVCKNCVAAVRARVEREMASHPAPAPAGNAGYGNASPAPQGQPWNAPGDYSAPVSAVEPGRVAMGIGVAFVIGLIAAIVIEKISMVSPIMIAYVYVLMGYGIGYGLHRLTGEGGPKMAGIAVGIMVVCLVISHLLLVHDILDKFFVGADAARRPAFGDAIMPVLSGLSFMHWVLILIGLSACFRGVNQQQ